MFRDMYNQSLAFCKLWLRILLLAKHKLQELSMNTIAMTPPRRNPITTKVPLDNCLTLTASRAVGGTFAFVVSSFAVQTLSHFVLAADHFASVPFMRAEPIMAMGVGVMLVQGLLLTALFSRFGRASSSPRDALLFGLGMGLFLGAYIAIVEPAKYMVPSIGNWIAVEGLAATAQFVLFGLGLGFVFRKDS
jgi:hypothetical protein